MTWDSLCVNRKLKSRKDISSEFKVTISEEDYATLKRVGCIGGVGRSLNENVGIIQNNWENPVSFCPSLIVNIEDFTIKEDTLFVWTDGSMNLKSNKAGFGVYFGKHSPHNYSSRTIGGPTIAEAELEAIE